MRVTLLGTGDTTGTPTVGCDCETCERARERGIPTGPGRDVRYVVVDVGTSAERTAATTAEPVTPPASVGGHAPAIA